MIIRKKKLKNKILVWDKNVKLNTIFLVEITKDENNKDVYKIIAKTKINPKEDNKKRKRKYMLVGTGLVLSFLLKDTAYQCLTLWKECPEVYETLKVWNTLSDTEKKTIMLEQITELIENNENYNEFAIETLKEKYPEYIEDYIKYISNIDYLNTMFSTRFSKVKMMENSIKLKKGITRSGYYKKPYIYTIEEKDAFFHEKLHADNLWLTRTLKILIDKDKYSLNEEVHASFGSVEDYSNIRAAYSLIGELIGPKKLEEYIFMEKPDEIWACLKKMYPEKETEVKELENIILSIFEKCYKDYKYYDQETNEFWKIYTEFYQETNGKNPEEDIVASYFKDQLYSITTLENKNKIDYGTMFRMGYITTDLENRDFNYKKLIIQYLLNTKNMNYENRPYFYELLESLALLTNEKTYETYEEFENSMIEYFTNEEFEEIIEALLYCTTEEEKNACINWCRRKRKQHGALKKEKK